jgi:hypothetical protein
MKQCVAPVSKRMVTFRTPCAVERSPDSRGLKVGLARTSCAARRSSSAACASHALSANPRDAAVPHDESQGVTPPRGTEVGGELPPARLELSQSLQMHCRLPGRVPVPPARRWRAHECTPAAEHSRAPSRARRRGVVGEPGPGGARQKRLLGMAPGPHKALSVGCLCVARRPCCRHSRGNKSSTGPTCGGGRNRRHCYVTGATRSRDRRHEKP